MMTGVFVVVKATVLLLAAMGMAACLRRASAALRHLVWTAGLGGVLCLPLLCGHLPRWQVAVRAPILHAISAPAPASPAPPPVVPETLPSSRVPAPPVAAAPPVTPPSFNPLPINAPPAAPAAPPPAPRPPWAVWALLAWALGAVLVLSRLAQGLTMARRLGRESVPVTEGPLAEAAAEAGRTLGLTRPVAVCTAAVTVPLTFGARRPVLLVPQKASDWPPSRLRAALLHEMAHVRRRDWPLQLMAHAACAVYWFHPLAWHAARRMRAEAEAACDDLVLGAGVPAPDYARHLLDVALGARRARLLGIGAVAMAQSPRVEGRLRAVLAAGRPRGAVRRPVAAGIAALALALALPLAALEFGAKQKAATADAPATTASVQPIPGGGSLRLVGISYNPSAHQPWWGMNGLPLASPPNMGAESVLSPMHPLPDQQAREFLIEAAGAPAGADFATNVPAAISTSQTGGANPTSYHLAVALPATAQTCTVRVGVASQPWSKVTTYDGGFLGEVTSGSDPLGGGFSNERPISVGFSPASVIDGKTAFTVSDNVTNSNYDTRVVAVDKHGKVVVPEMRGQLSGGTLQQRTVLFPGLRLKDIKDIQFQARPYHWIEFRNIPLNPQTTPAQAAASPASRADLKIVYLKDVSSSDSSVPGKPFLLTPMLQSGGRYAYILTDTRSGKQYLEPAASQGAKAAINRVIWNRVVEDAPVILTGADVEPQTTVRLQPVSTNLGTGQQTTVPVLVVHYTPGGGKKLQTFTAAHHGDVIGILLDRELLAAPFIEETISGDTGEISVGSDSLADLQRLADRINGGVHIPSPPAPASSPPPSVAGPQGARDAAFRALWTTNWSLLPPVQVDAQQVKSALDKGADVDTRFRGGRTALMWAAIGGRADVARLLLDHGAGVNAVDKSGMTPLMDAVTSRKTDCISLLLAHHADVNAADRIGQTALILAATVGDVNAVRLLLAHGANVQASSSFAMISSPLLKEHPMPGRWTALAIAEKNHDTAVVAALKAAGATDAAAPAAASSTASPGAAAALVAQGLLLQQKGQPRDGIPAFRRAVQLDPNDAEAQFNLAQALFNINTRRFGPPPDDAMIFYGVPPAVLDQAIIHIRKAVTLKAKNPEYQFDLATYLDQRNGKGDNAEAVDLYRRVLSLLPLLPKNGYVLGRNPRWDTQMAERCIAYYNLGDDLLKEAQYSAAAAALSQALLFPGKPDDQMILLSLGDAWNGEKHRAQARVAWKKSLASQMQNPIYQNKARQRLAQFP